MFSPNFSKNLRMLLALLALGLMLSAGGCSWFKKKPVPLNQGGSETVVPAPGPGGEAPGVNPSAQDIHPEILGQPQDFPTESGVNDVHFDYDRADIRGDQHAILDRDVEYFKAHPDAKVMIEGHCDERGTEEYNFALGQRRAGAIQQYLIENGIDASRLVTISKGKDAPLDPSRNEAAYAKNRRAHFLRVTTR